MVKFFATFSRVIALVLLVTFTFVTCSMPSGSKPEEEKIVITPGEGTPTYFYMNPDGSVSDTPTERIGLYIEDNKNAEGVLVVADKEGVNERVTVYNETNNSVVVTYFEPNHKWPSYMNIKIGDETAKGFIGYYKEETSTYDISFMGNGEWGSTDFAKPGF